MEHAYNNPIVNAFIQLLKTARDSNGSNNLLLHHHDYVEADEFLIGTSSSELLVNTLECAMIYVFTVKHLYIAKRGERGHR